MSTSVFERTPAGADAPQDGVHDEAHDGVHDEAPDDGRDEPAQAQGPSAGSGSSAGSVAGSVASEPWWAEHRFEGIRPAALGDLLNGRLDEMCRRLTDVLDAQAEHLTDDELERIRSDVVIANRRSSVTWTTQAVAGSTVGWLYDAFPYVATVVVLAWTTTLWPGLVVALLVVTAVVLAPAHVARRLRPALVDAAGLLWVSLCVLLVLLPMGVGVLWRALAVVVTVLLATLILGVGLMILKFMPLFPGLLVTLVLSCGALYGAQGIADRLHVLVDAAPEPLLTGIMAGFVVGAALSVLVVVVQLLNQAALTWELASRLRHAPEAEFVQSVMWLLATRQAPVEGHTSILGRARDHDARQDVAEQLRWIARVVECGVCAHLCRLDPRNAAVLDRTFQRKAAVLHRWNRDLLLGDARCDARLETALWDAALAGTARRWSALPEADVDTSPVVRLGQRLVVWFGKLFTLGVAVAAAVVAHLEGQDQVATTAAVAAAWLLLEFVKPGAGSKLGKAVSETKDLRSMIPNSPTARP